MLSRNMSENAMALFPGAQQPLETQMKAAMFAAALQQVHPTLLWYTVLC